MGIFLLGKEEILHLNMLNMKKNRILKRKDSSDIYFVFSPAGPPKPSIPRIMLEYVDSDAMDWLTNLVDID